MTLVPGFIVLGCREHNSTKRILNLQLKYPYDDFTVHIQIINLPPWMEFKIENSICKIVGA